MPAAKNPAPFECQECGAATRPPTCRRCGSTDLDLRTSFRRRKPAGARPGGWRLPRLAPAEDLTDGRMDLDAFGRIDPRLTRKRVAPPVLPRLSLLPFTLEA